MKRRKRIAYALLTVALLSVSALTPLEIKAGYTEILLDGESLESANWNNPEGDVVTDDKMLVFPEESTEYTRFITKSPVKLEKTTASLVNITASMRLDAVPQGGSFVIAFGLSGIESELGEEGNIEVAFTNNDGIKTGITYYDEEGNAKVLAEPTNCGMSIGREAKIAVDISTDGELKVTVNGRTICNATLPVSGEGRVGFLQTGECHVTLSDFQLVHYQYDRPENTNISEDFEKGEMDASKLTAKMITAAVSNQAGQSIEEYNGNQVFMHRNIGQAYIGTMYPYSNFEMTFDVPYFNVTREFSEEGNLALTGTGKIMLTIGSEQADWETPKWDAATEVIVLENGYIYSNKNREAHTAPLTKNPFTEGKPFSMKVRMVDSVLTVGMKWLEEEQYETVLEYQLRGGTPTGHIHIWTPQAATYAIDNLKITNLDDGAKLIETEYKSSKFKVPEGNEPEPLERVYAEMEEKTSSWYLLIPVTAILSVVALGITVLVSRGKKNQKEASKDEQ